MARTSIQQRINQLEERKRTLKARLGKQERRDDTRRKVLIGALVLHRLEHSRQAEFTGRLREWLVRELPDFLVRDGDQALFRDLLGSQIGGGEWEDTSIAEAERGAGSEVK